MPGNSKGKAPRRAKAGNPREGSEGEPEPDDGEALDGSAAATSARPKSSRQEEPRPNERDPAPAKPATSGSRQSRSQPSASSQCVAFKCHHGKHIRVEPNGTLRANSAVIGDSEKFQLLYHEDGRVSLQSHYGKYVLTEPNGEVSATGTALGESTKFQLLEHDDGTVSFMGPKGYFAADRTALKGNRGKVGTWEKFLMKSRAAKSAKGAAEASDDAPAAAADDAGCPLFDAFCELEAVLFAEANYAKTHTDKTAKAFEKRAQQRRAQGQELSLRHFCEENGYPPSFCGCVSGWDASVIREETAQEEDGPAPHWSSILAQAAAEGGASIRTAFGIPASSADRADEAVLARLERLCRLPCCAAVGPMGLSFAALERETAEAEAQRSAQLAVAERQVRLCRELGLTLIVQLQPDDDEAERAMAELLVATLGDDAGTQRILLSAFRGRPKCVAAMLKLFPGLVVGFSGLLTHSKLQKTLGEVAFDTPLNRVVLESLGPRFPPALEGMGEARGSFSHPLHITAIAEELARVKSLNREEVLRAAWANVRQLFRLADTPAAAAAAPAD